MKKIDANIFDTVGRGTGRNPSELTEEMYKIKVGDVVEVTAEDLLWSKRKKNKHDTYFHTLGKSKGMAYSYRTIEKDKRWVVKRIK